MTSWSFVFFQWLKRDLAGRYRGSWLGLAWPILQPLAQISVFTLIFHGFMQLRWSTLQTSPLQGDATPNSQWVYAINVLVGMSVFNFFSEVLGRAPTAILSQPNLVTKVKFPLLILPSVTASTALVHILVGSLVSWLASWGLGTGSFHVLWLPLWVLPVMLYGLSAAYLLASLGVYVRDLVQIMPAATSVLMFLTPIFYPLAAVPQTLRTLFSMNPLTWAAESLRGILLLSLPLDLASWGMHLGVSLITMAMAYRIFFRLKAGFSDVL